MCASHLVHMQANLSYYGGKVIQYTHFRKESIFNTNEPHVKLKISLTGHQKYPIVITIPDKFRYNLLWWKGVPILELGHNMHPTQLL